MNKLIFFLLLIISFPAFSQSYEDNISFGDEAFNDEDYFSASIYYYNILQNDSTNISVAYKYAESCRLFNDYKNAEKWYAFVNNSLKRKKYPLSLFYLALMNKSNAKYSEAKNNFSQYHESHKLEDNYFAHKAFHEIEACEFAEKQIHDTIPVLIEHLSENVNTPYSEFGALQLGDSVLLYSSLRPNSTDEFEYLLPNFYLAKIYRSKTTVAGLSKGNELSQNINNKESNNVDVSYRRDHKRMYFSRCTVGKLSETKCSVYVCEQKNGKWQQAVKLNDKINLSEYTSTQPALGTYNDKGDEALYFVSDRPGGIGKLDIWYSIIKKGKYNDPVNLGSTVNSPGDEISPFYYNNTKTLYFSSDWHDGLGGYDIFKSSGALNLWSTPVNMGFPINTSYNDMYFTVNEVDSDGYFTSNRPGSFFIKGETCCNDIWAYEWLKLIQQKIDTVPKIVDTVNYEKNIIDLLPLTLYFHNDIPDPASNDTVTKLNYKTTLAEYTAMKDVYENEYSTSLNERDKSKAINDIDEFFENYVESGFSKLEQFSEWLLKDLRKGKDIKITVKGYCSPLHTAEYNINLAKRRISSLINYFKIYENGVFVNYMNSASADAGRLEIHEDPIGKAQASSLVSDNPNDQRNSIYSRAAALERKIQIIMYQSNDSIKILNKFSKITFSEKLHDFGKITAGEKKLYTFSFQNTGNSNLIISGVETSCGCIVSDFPKDPILPGAKGIINILFDSKDALGMKSETITVYSNSKVPKIKLTIVAEALPKSKIKKEQPQKIQQNQKIPQKTKTIHKTGSKK